MLLKLFKINHPIVFIFIPILAAALWLPELILGSNEYTSFDTSLQSPIYKALLGLIGPNYFIQKSLAFVLLLIEGFLLIRLNAKYILIESKTYLPAIIFVMVASAFPYFQNLHPLLITNLFLILAFTHCFEITKDRNLFKKYFESGFILGIGALIYFPISIFLTILWLTLFILRTFNWREWIASIIGFITPIAIYTTILFLNDSHLIYFEYFNSLWAHDPSDIIVKGFAVYPLIGIGILIVLSFLYNISIIGAKKINTRKYFLVTLWLLAISFASKVFLPFISTAMIFVFAIPASFLLTMFLCELRNKWIAEISFFLLLSGTILSIVMQLN